jgi:hypothetical protein
MAKPSDTTNYIYRQGTAPNTRAAVSQKNKVFGYMVGKKAFQQIGVLSEFTTDESRTVDPIRGVGFGDMVAELVPSVTDPMTLTINKTLLYAVNVFQALGYKGGVEGLVRSLRHHRWPFDIKQELVFSEIASKFDLEGVTVKNASQQQVANGGGEGAKITTVKALLTFFEGCWLSSYGTSYTSDAAIVAENSQAMVTDIISGTDQYGEFVDTGLAPIAANGSSGTGFSLRFASGNTANAQATLVTA